MAACSQEAALENVSSVKIHKLCERGRGGGGEGGEKKYIQQQEKTRSQPGEKREMWKHLQRKLFKKVKRLYNLGRHVCASGSRNKCTDETLGGGGGKWSQFIHLFVFPVCEAASNPSLGRCACVCLWICLYVTASLTRDIITLSSLSKSSSSSSSRSSTACWRLQQMNKRKEGI